MSGHRLFQISTTVLAFMIMATLASAESTCRCDYHPGGCRITTPAPQGTACHCTYFAWGCGGIVKDCDIRDPKCAAPDDSLASCLLGGGDCGGYKCDCEYHPGGCKISFPARDESACHCRYLGLWSCDGVEVLCDTGYELCAHPDTSKDSCLLGGGDCGGY